MATDATQHTTKPKAFKDYFDGAAADALAAQIRAVMPDFDTSTFRAKATHGIESLAFSGRVQSFSRALAASLPQDIPEALRVLTASLPPSLPNCDAVTDGWLQWPVGQFIADHGVPWFEASMEAMLALTQCFTSEFAVRPFVETYPKEVSARFLSWTQHANPHVRRWCSEGLRPRLPWGKRLRALCEDPTPIWPIVEALIDDPEPYVWRSVANNLNDIAKDHPEQVLARCEGWEAEAKQQGLNRGRVIRHALRSLVKEGHPRALAVFGCARSDTVRATLHIRDQEVHAGGTVLLEASLVHEGSAPIEVIIDYQVHDARPKGGGMKVFKWRRATLKPGELLRLEKRHPMRVTTVRRLYPGQHRVVLQVNGQDLATHTFVLRP